MYFIGICSPRKLRRGFLRREGAWGADPRLQRKFLDFRSKMERFGALNRSTLRSPHEDLLKHFWNCFSYISPFPFSFFIIVIIHHFSRKKITVVNRKSISINRGFTFPFKDKNLGFRFHLFLISAMILSGSILIDLFVILTMSSSLMFRTICSVLDMLNSQILFLKFK